ncbi:MAG: ABC transporter substrate-binding protein [Deltaproteobacteria bacterium]|nr:ABC transporter substrate-binding protein [Deltaproteobacteria bacterium]
MAERPPRVVSLVPSLTETVFALGAGGSLVGRTRYCIEPAADVGQVPVVGGPKDPDIPELLALRPGLVLMSVEENRREDYDRLRASGIDILPVRVRAVSDVAPVILELGRRLGAVDAARAMAAEVEGAAEAVVSFVNDIQRASAQSLLHSFCPVWREPWMVASQGTYLADVLRRVGLPSLLHLAEAPGVASYREVALDEIVEVDPGIVLLPSEPYPFGPDDRDEVLSWPIRACREQQVHLVDGRMLTWYGARTASALHALSLLALRWVGVEEEPPAVPPTVH